MRGGEEGYECPGVVEFLAFAEIVELGCQDGFDVFWIEGHDAYHTGGTHLLLLLL
jgi:hypothetical protein